MDDDFNTAEAVAVLFDLASELNRAPNLETARLLKALAGILGFLERTPTDFLQGGQTAAFAAEIAALIEGRHQARLTKNWAESDRIREALAAKNVLVEDGENGTTWRLK
jgi:cysteinyl-tRNA synthetase